MNRVIDLRVDTLGAASEAMKAAMQNAQSGDDVMAEDRATNALESYAADLCGKESALLVPTGTMGNLLALLVHVPRGGEIIVGSKSHIFNYEASGAAALGSIAYNHLPDDNGILQPEDVAGAVRNHDIYSPRTHLVCVENTHNLAGGLASTPDEIEAVAKVAQKHKLPLHLDGARIFYACAAMEEEPKAYTQHVDSLMFSLVKGLSAPVGAMLVGGTAFIEEARRLRKMLGGGMRMTGYISAPALTGLRTMRSGLKEQVDKARTLAERLSTIPALKLDITKRLTNILYIWLRDETVDAAQYGKRLEERGIRCFGNSRGVRAVIHNGITDDEIQETAKIFEDVFTT